MSKGMIIGSATHGDTGKRVLISLVPVRNERRGSLVIRHYRVRIGDWVNPYCTIQRIGGRMWAEHYEGKRRYGFAASTPQRVARDILREVWTAYDPKFI